MSSSPSSPTVGPVRPAISSTQDSPELAAAYEEVSTHQFEHGKQLIGALSLSEGERVLDIGAGTGRLGAYVAGLVGPSGYVIGIDPLPLRIEIARSKAIANFEARVGGAEDLSEFENDGFDVVYLNSVFHWVGDKPRALAEMFRVLKPNGRVGLNCQDPDQPHQSRILVRQAVAKAAIKLDPQIAYPSLGVSGDELKELVKAAGFVEYVGELRTFIDTFTDVDALLTWSSSSTFGNFLLDVAAADRARVREALGHLLEPKRSPQGIQLERYLTFVTARKPPAD
jgi:ubiquinone/menaquinone biosynthesis C-methylase UbiE